MLEVRCRQDFWTTMASSFTSINQQIHQHNVLS